MTPEQQKVIALAKARQRKAMASQSQQTPLAKDLRTQPERAQYSREMQMQAFRERPTSGELLQSGLFGTAPQLPSMLAGQADLRQGEPGLSPAFMPEIVTGLGGAAAARAGKNLYRGAAKRVKTAKRDYWDDLVEPYNNRAAQIRKELRGTDKSIAGTYKFRLSQAEKAQKEVLRKIPRLKEGANVRDALNVVSDEISTSSKLLKSRLKKSNKVVTDTELENAIRKQFAKYSDSLEGLDFVGQDELIDQAIIRVLRAYDAQPKTVAGLWEARKQVDNIFKELNGVRRYQQALSPGQGLIPSKQEKIWDNTRKAMLDLMESKSPSTKSQMRRLSILYDARQTLAEKAPDVGTSLYKRSKQALGLGEKSIQLKPRNWRQ